MRKLIWLSGVILLIATITLLGWLWHKHHSPVIDRNAIAQPMNDLAITRDLAYAPGNRHRLDIYAPRTPGPPRPVVVYIYGGSWDSGAKADVAWVGAAFARRGYVTLIPDYRLYPEVLWPAFLHDNAAAVRWAHDHATDYGGDPSSIIVIGYSAGAFNAISLAVDPRWLSGVGMDARRDLRGVVGISGPYDFVPIDIPKLQIIFGQESQWPDTQPLNHVDGQSPPLLLLTGDRDRNVDSPYSENLAAKVNAHDGVARVIHYPLFDHAGMQNNLAPEHGQSSRMMDDIASFIANPK